MRMPRRLRSSIPLFAQPARSDYQAYYLPAPPPSFIHLVLVESKGRLVVEYIYFEIVQKK